MKLSEIEAKVGLPFKARPTDGGPVRTFEAKLSNGDYVSVSENGTSGVWTLDYNAGWEHIVDPKPKRKALAYIDQCSGHLEWYVDPIEGNYPAERAPGFDIEEVGE